MTSVLTGWWIDVGNVVNNIGWLCLVIHTHTQTRNFYLFVYHKLKIVQRLNLNVINEMKRSNEAALETLPITNASIKLYKCIERKL
jgi:hypothetical protein